jgi:hypothetical protein
MIGIQIQRAATFVVLSVAVGISGLADADDIVQLSGKHITLTTDIDDASQRKDLVESFDAAVPQWSSFWGLPDTALQGFHVRAFVMKNKQAFGLAGYIPATLPNFPYGYALQDRVWIVAQKSEYYTRHLLLHEGVHALAFDQFGGTGPSWFMEGTAEMLSVHRGQGDRTVINEVPVDRDAVPYWGRFKVMNQSRQQDAIPSLAHVLGYPRDLQSDVESYGWSWAAVMLLERYPDTRSALIAAANNGKRSSAIFNNDLRRELQSNWPLVKARWQLMCHHLGYGFDWDRERVDLSMNDQVWDGSDLKVQVKADRGWQSIGVRLREGMKINVVPKGECTLADEPKPWLSRPSGVTVRYHRGRPLGQLLGCMVTDSSDDAKNLEPQKVAPFTRAAQVLIRKDCWLLFRVNDALGELADNRGQYEVKITQAKN